MKLLLYSFDTKRNKSLLQGQNIYFLRKLKEDFKVLSDKIIEEKPDLILGIAAFRRSQIEVIAINKFNSFKVSKKNKKESYELETELFSKYFKVSKQKAYSTFCNWAAFKFAEFVEENKLKTRVGFIHICQKDAAKLTKMLEKLT